MQAFVLTRGKTHYRTEDRGKSWRSFEMPVPPALVSKPLSFHSDETKYGYILFQGTACSSSGWGAVCHDEVRGMTTLSVRSFTDTSLIRPGIQKRRSATPPGYCCLRLLAVFSRIVAQISSMTLMETLFTVLPSTRPAPRGAMHYLPVAYFPPPISSRLIPRLRTWVSERTPKEFSHSQ